MRCSLIMAERIICPRASGIAESILILEFDLLTGISPIGVERLARWTLSFYN